MSFMYKASMARAPNKRKIKLNEENLIQLMNNSDDDDEEDEDYTISSDKKADVIEGEDDESSEADLGTDDASESQSSEAESDDDQPTTSQQMQQSRRKRRQLNAISVTVGDLTEKLKSKCYGMSASAQEILLHAKKHLMQSQQSVNSIVNLPKSVCSICLNEWTSVKPNSILTCSICAISVHQDCYNMDCYSSSKPPSDIWICDACIYGGSDVVCQFCPNLFGCMKETKCGRWVHVICARSILSKFPSNSLPLSRKHVSNIYIQLEELSKKHYGAKECLLCDDRLVAKTGICVKCDAGLCKSTVHVTCAQKYGLLSRPKLDPSDGYSAETYIVNCPLHCVEEQMKKKQRLFLVERKTMELMKRKKRNKAPSVEKTINKKLKELRDAKNRSHNAFQSPRAPLEQVPRLLSSDAHFTNLLNRKAEKMFGIDTKHPALIIPKSTEIRKKHNVAPSLTTEFAAYFMDRELRIEEEKEHLATSLRVNESLLEKQEYEKRRYNEVREKLIAAENMKTDLQKEYDNIKCLLSSIMDTLKTGQSLDRSTKIQKVIAPKKMMSPKHTAPRPLSQVAGKKIIPDADSVIGLKRCGICKGCRNQHLLVKCDLCLEWQHLGCLDPPLSQMPKRTKFTLWQCSECANSSSSSSSDSEIQNRGSFICTDGRRATRRVRRVPEKLAIGFPDREMKREMVGHSELIQQHQKKLREAFENLARQQRFSQNKSDTPSTSNDESKIEPKISDSKTVSDESQNLQLGISCDNYLSVAARMPIINQRSSFFHSTPNPENTRRVIILKKTLPITQRSRPAGLGQMKHFAAKTKTRTKPPMASQLVSSSKTPVAKTCDIKKSADSSESAQTELSANKDSVDKGNAVPNNNTHTTQSKNHRSSPIQTTTSVLSSSSDDKATKSKPHKVKTTVGKTLPASDHDCTVENINIGACGNQDKATIDDCTAVDKVKMILSSISSKMSSTSNTSLKIPSKEGGSKSVNGKNSVNQKLVSVRAVGTKRQIPTDGEIESSSAQTKKVITSKDITNTFTTQIKAPVLPKKKILYKISSAKGRSWSAKMLTAGLLLSRDGKTLKIPSSKLGPVTAKHGRDTYSVRFVPKNVVSAGNTMTIGEYMKTSTFKEAKELAVLSAGENMTKSEKSVSRAKASLVQKKVIKECSVCGSVENQTCIVQCSTCRKNYHWECCDPPLRANPVSRYSLWECSDCVDGEESDKNGDGGKNVKNGTTITPEGRRVTSRKRKPPDLFDPASTISDQQKIYKSITKHRKKMAGTTSGKTSPASDVIGTAPAARCRPIPLRYIPCNRTRRPPNVTRLLNLKGLNLSGLKTLSIVQKQMGPNTSVYSIVPHTKANMPSVPTNTSTEN